MAWIMRFYHTETQYRAGIVFFQLERKGPREAVISKASNLAKARGNRWLLISNNKGVWTPFYYVIILLGEVILCMI